MRRKRLVESIKREEGTRDLPYQCPKGVWTISYGFTSINGVKVTQYTPKLTEVQVIETLYEHIFISLNIAMKYVSNFSKLTHIRQEVLINMAYQMGTGLFGFIETRKYIEQERFKQASIEMLDSTWARIDSPNRAKRMSRKFK